MRLIADLHIHSKYSRSCSPNLDLEHIEEWCKYKGIDIVGTADFTHPKWFEELKNKLEEQEPGLYKLKGTDGKVKFIMTTELSCIYMQGGKCRRIHLCILAPSIQTVEKIIANFEKRGFNLKSDGRPILGISAKDLAKVILEIEPKCLIIPAHAWTPWFAVFGSKSGFNSLEECFEEITPNIYAIETGLSCYDTETEVLTENGWKKFPDVAYNDKICTLNLKTNKIEFQNPTKIHTYNYRGKMYRLKTKRVDLFVTPNHKLLFSPCDFRQPPKFSLKEAEFLFNKSKRFKKDGNWTGSNPEYFTLPAVKIKHGSQHYSGYCNKQKKSLSIKPWLKFFGFWIAEGWTTGGKDGDYNVCLANQNNTLLFEIKQILESFGYDVYWDKKINHTIRVRDYQLFHYLRQFGKCSDKFIPLETKLLSKKLLEIFLEYYIKGDGHIYGRDGKGLSATTTSIQLRDDLQEIALKVGMSAYYKLHNKKGTPFRSPGYKYQRIYKQRNDSWVIYFIRKNIHTVLPSIIKKYNYIESWIDFAGPVFCVSVSNQVIYIRRNGIPLWCGNSDPPMNWQLSALDKITLISNSDAHSPANLGREANVFDIEQDKLNYNEIYRILKEKDDKKFLYTIEFFPEEGKYHFDGHADCHYSAHPEESKKNKNICPTCKKELVLGVMHRVNELADRKDISQVKNIPYKNLIPLQEIIADTLGVGKNSKKVQEEYFKLIKKYLEFQILIDLGEEELKKITAAEITKAIMNVRDNKVKIIPGYDGVYGKIEIINDSRRPRQTNLF